MSQNGQALPRINYHDPPHLSTNHSHLHLITAAITTLHIAPRLSSLSCPILWIQHGPSLYSGLLAEYTYLCYLPDDTYPLSSLSPPDTYTSVDSRDSQALQDSYPPRTCQRTETQSESQRTVHNTSRKPLTSRKDSHHCCLNRIL